jgi:C-terminal processing protease CtpA/Prc
MQYVISDFRTPKGVVLEGRGLHPDIEVKSSRADVIAGRDRVLERAIAHALGK